MENIVVTALQEGAKGTVVNFTDDHVASKLMSMGMLPGSAIEVIRIAPLQGGLYLKVDGNGLALRMQEAAHIQVKQ